VGAKKICGTRALNWLAVLRHELGFDFNPKSVSLFERRQLKMDLNINTTNNSK
jgi:hypothetical protein